jgi:hypothetical protein
MIGIDSKNRNIKVIILFLIVFYINVVLLKKDITNQGVQTFLSNNLFIIAMQNTPLFLL